jgi:hypothetical protein
MLCSILFPQLRRLLDWNRDPLMARRTMLVLLAMLLAVLLVRAIRKLLA